MAKTTKKNFSWKEVLITAILNAFGTMFAQNWAPEIFRSIWDYMVREPILVVALKRNETREPVNNVKVCISKLTTDKEIDSGTTEKNGIVRLNRIPFGDILLEAKLDEGGKMLQYGEVHEIKKLPTYLELLVGDNKWTESQREFISTTIVVSDDIGIDSTKLKIRNSGRDYYAQFKNHNEIYVGTIVSYRDRVGLYQSQSDKIPSVLYDPKAFTYKHSYWAYLIYPIVFAENSASFVSFQTFDRANFTFGLGAFPAHVPNEYLVRLFRSILKTPMGRSYFPDLGILNGRICKYREGKCNELETDNSTEGLMRYLNPNPQQIDPPEVANGAKFLYWAMEDPAGKDIQVDLMVDTLKNILNGLNKRFNLKDLSDKVIIALLDVRWQGRASTREIQKALSSSDPFESLLKIRSEYYPERIERLRTAFNFLESEGHIGSRIYDPTSGEFVRKQ